MTATLEDFPIRFCAMSRISLVLALLLLPSLAGAETLVVQHDSGPMAIELKPARNIFAADYAEYRATSDGLEKTPRDTWANRSTCRYLIGEDAAVRQCEGAWEGVVRTADGFWDLGPDLHLRRANYDGECGVDGANAPIALPTTAGAAERSPQLALEQPHFLEVTLVTDRRLAQLDAGGLQVPDPALSYFASGVLFDGTAFVKRVLPLLTGVVNFDSSSPWGERTSEPVRSGGYLDDFNDWLVTRPNNVLNRDVVVLMTGWDLEGSTVGLANVSGACDLGINGALVYGEGPLASVAQTLAHELGHTIGMWHDAESNSCPQEGFVMQAVYSEDGPYPTDFSSCSIARADDFLSSSAGSCITPDTVPAFPQPTCGDGLVEGNETCDCGPDGCAGRNPCCNEATCQLAVGAVCAGTDGCCNLETCQPREASENFVCREARGTCDVAEVCMGGAVCPDDVVGPTGGDCQADTWSGTCYLGECVTRGGQCEAVFDLYFFDTPPYSEMCGGPDAGCQVLECVANRACVLTEEVPRDGTECGTGRQCQNGTCVGTNVLPSPECLAATDIDGDGVDACGDDADLCPTDPNKTDPGFCGCLRPETCPEAGGMQGDAGNNGGGDPGDNLTGDAGDEVIVLGPTNNATGGGCAQSGEPPSGVALILFALLAVRHRRSARPE